MIYYYITDDILEVNTKSEVEMGFAGKIAGNSRLRSFEENQGCIIRWLCHLVILL